ncbi:hypothetical protein H5410_032003 [Solanum commersonii]|uniref:Uncharacterized protein n=1 Tax=Solanum commersonii TaxID=4109 RepID=A0A9J5YJX6_SOLCO|nr:hypothetical protein H5410_032003 [Solanum commersonii]
MKICESSDPFIESPRDRIFIFCSSVLSPEGKEQIGSENKQLVDHRATLQGSTTSPNDPG